MTEDEARLILRLTDERLDEIETALSNHSRHSGPASRLAHVFPGLQLRRLAHRLRGLAVPRIGRLRHYAPRTLQVPAAYLRTRPHPSAPTISIVTPSFQQGRFITRTIQSVLAQDYPGLEYVVQDGGSTDETIQVLERYSDRLSRWVSEPDGGHADALNRGFRLTTGEVMGWLNSDDLLLPGALACVGSYFATHPETDVVYGHRLLIDENDGEIGAWILPRHDDLALTLADFVPQETLFWRRRVWEATGCCLDGSYGYALDWELLLRFRSAGARMVRLPRLIGAFRVHAAQRTSAERALGLEEMARLRERGHDQPVSLAEVHNGLRPYLRRHVWAHLRFRLAERFPHARTPVLPLIADDPGAPPLPPVPAHPDRGAVPESVSARESRG